MILISYDIKDDKLRTKFSKYIKKYGHRIQYSVFEICNSRRILENIMIEIDYLYKNKFSQSDSVIIIETSKNCKISKWGYASNEDNDIIVVS